MKQYFSFNISLILVFVLSLVIMAFSSPDLHAGTEEVVKKSFTAAEGGTLFLETDLGSVEIDTKKGDEVNLEVIMKVGTSDEEKAREVFDDFVLEFKQKGSDVHIDGDYKRNNSLFSWVSGKKLKVRFIITVPKKYNLQVKTRGGKISVSEIEGNVKAKTSGGSLKFAYVKGTLRGRTSGGSITLDGCSGDVEVNTSGGRITIGRVKGEVKAHTSGGSIRVEEVMGTIKASTSGGSVAAFISKQPRADCKLTTSGGSISVKLAEDIKVDVNAKTSGGRVRTDFPITIQGTMSRSRLQGAINGGGPELYLRTAGGSIKITKID